MMQNEELKIIWSTLATEKLIGEDLARESIARIIKDKRNGIFNKMLQKNKTERAVYLGFVLLVIPGLMLFIHYRSSHGLSLNTNANFPGPFLILGTVEAFFIYTIVRLQNTISFIEYSCNSTSVKESLIQVKEHFNKITVKGNWIGSISLMLIFILILVDTLFKIGGLSSLNFSFEGPRVFESYFLVLLLVLMASAPFIVRSNSSKYSGFLRDINNSIEELGQQ